MEPCDTLIGPVKTELNHIYTEKPFETATGWDMGWFCREHALQTAALLSCLGYTTQICIGDVVVQVPNEIVISTVGSGDDHAWCGTEAALPIDLSLTVRHSQVSCEDVQLICNSCPAYLSGFDLLYCEALPDRDFSERLHGAGKIIAYNEKLRVAASVAELMSDPFSFLHRPPRGAPAFTDIYGENVFFAITAHLLKLIRGEGKPLYPYRSPQDTVRTIVKRNPEARAQVIAVLNAAS